jgi:cytochrome c553
MLPRRGDPVLRFASRLRPVFVAGLALFFHPGPATAEQPPNTIAARALACANCHGKLGEGTQDVYFPRLAGKPSGYLLNQLEAFRVGRRKYPPMNYLLEFQRTEFLRELAEYFAAQRPPLRPPESPAVSADLLNRGETLVTRGDAERNIPACTSCHGPSLTGMEPGIPGLIGLRSKYISAQIGAFRYGTRTAAEPDCMQLVAARLTQQDVTAVAAWLASRAAWANLSPAPKGSYALPFACGSEPQ